MKETFAAGREITALRRKLHQAAELSGRERNTARIIAGYLGRQKPDELITGLGGFGLAAVYNGARPGKTVLLRAELDALPIKDEISAPYRSFSNAAHKCGHDGHAAAVCAVARALKIEPLARGRAVLLFQPAEETLAGAKAVLADKKFKNFMPDRVFALHNFPGFELGSVILKAGVMCRATAGIIMEFAGRVSHASEPEKGLNPAGALAEIILAVRSHPHAIPGAKLTVVGVNAGGPYFGTSPGSGTLMLTARAETQAGLVRLVKKCERTAAAVSGKHGLKLRLAVTDACPETRNSPCAVKLVRRAAEAAGLKTAELRNSFPTAEDFGCFTAAISGALAGIGSGKKQPPLHSPRYDYPDRLLTPSARLLETVLRGSV
ncbi:MAG: amidohydrolase [Elusimicrobiaceae bacterium]|nr:amidohydrolase [Elusimicrobiaceae bacterium]